MTEKALTTLQDVEKGLSKILPEGLVGAIVAWADARTLAGSRRRADLLRDKARAVGSFFAWVGKPVEAVTPVDVKTWQAWLESGRGFETKPLAPSTVYAMISRISSFYNWVLESPDLAVKVRSNPVILARPKAPKAYQSESTKALNDEDLSKLLVYVKEKADSGSNVGKRDYAMLLMYVLTGLRRAEVINLRWGDIKINGVGMVISVHVKGGTIENKAVDFPAVRVALQDYLEASGRLDAMANDTPLWTRHDLAGQPGEALTSHAFVKNLKRYAKDAGVGPIHLHQTRHTFARIVADESGSLVVTQHELGHSNLATTKAYVKRVGVKHDNFSTKIAGRLGL